MPDSVVVDHAAIRAIFQRALNRAVSLSPAALMRRYWPELNTLRSRGVTWQTIAENLQPHGIPFTAEQLRAAFRYERVRIERAPRVGQETLLIETSSPGIERLLAQSADVE